MFIIRDRRSPYDLLYLSTGIPIANVILGCIYPLYWSYFEGDC
ncbi:hypothetical protein HMPREF1869_00324 [Bacteroidales bacterium KA00251]|nr:hypothetical protein HMPREF1869_00324 [Bacteroidales bacterium KA00251]